MSDSSSLIEALLSVYPPKLRKLVELRNTKKSKKKKSKKKKP